MQDRHLKVSVIVENALCQNNLFLPSSRSAWACWRSLVAGFWQCWLHYRSYTGFTSLSRLLDFMKQMQKHSLKNHNRWWTVVITGTLKHNRSHCSGNMMAHLLSRSFGHCHQFQRLWYWWFGIWREFCLWTTCHTRRQSLGMSMLLCFGIWRKPSRDNNKGRWPCFSWQWSCCTSHENQSWS